MTLIVVEGGPLLSAATNFNKNSADRKKMVKMAM
jgi:hypothetical protein